MKFENHLKQGAKYVNKFRLIGCCSLLVALTYPHKLRNGLRE